MSFISNAFAASAAVVIIATTTHAELPVNPAGDQCELSTSLEPTSCVTRDASTVSFEGAGIWVGGVDSQTRTTTGVNCLDTSFGGRYSGPGITVSALFSQNVFTGVGDVTKFNTSTTRAGGTDPATALVSDGSNAATSMGGTASSGLCNHTTTCALGTPTRSAHTEVKARH
jgi:hypothetical protein